MCDVQELRGRVSEERRGKGDTGRLGRRKETQETAGRHKRLQGGCRETQETAGKMQGDAGRCREMQGDAGRCREMQGDAGNQIARLSKE